MTKTDMAFHGETRSASGALTKLRGMLNPEIAWAAGLFEGEGSISENQTTLVLQLKMTDPEPVFQFARIVVFGDVYGPYAYKTQKDGSVRKPFWVWVARGFDALEVLERLWPWLSARRKARALELAPLDAILLLRDEPSAAA